MDVTVRIAGRSDTGFNAELDLTPPSVSVDTPQPRKGILRERSVQTEEIQEELDLGGPEEGTPDEWSNLERQSADISKIDAALVENTDNAKSIKWSDGD